MSKLGEILQQEAGAEIDANQAEADSRVQQIISEAKNQANTLLEKHRKRIEAEARAAIQQAQSTAELNVAIARTRAKGEAMDLVRQKVLAMLQEISVQPKYGEVLQTLAEEALEAAEAAEKLVVHPDDQEKLVDWAEHRGLDLQTDPKLRLGVRIVCRGGKKVENILPERLNRAWDTLAPEVTKLLWE